MTWQKTEWAKFRLAMDPNNPNARRDL
ncbi:MAG: hypothetical protein JWN04_5310, partial [Myxococcaceae bacterium]|nr:hypothetical protein [Myxococcaceae bacterium]